ncbi:MULTISPECIES: hypothetical protein [Streptomyces]|uniref:hypothetical protein n=1 Tax=Streptomyces TaxID=1883 RepID=UPI000A55AB69|nr:MULTISPECIES: hypothetical protein [Streptomyces]WTD02958.1 hypothetical protein OH717_10490 [Streptomyces albidoflavus]WTD07107.1 hypothetical protein OH717_33340 [Streptomyces albidoflavus]
MKTLVRWTVAVSFMLLPLAGTAHAEPAAPAKPKQWYSTATCGVEKIGKGDHGKKQLKGSGKGKSKGEAEKAAQRDVQKQISDKYGKGYRAHHCTFRSSRR